MNYYCYILSNLDNNRTYIGITNNLTKRLLKHNSKKGAKATRTSCTWYYNTVVGMFDKSNALSFEYEWKHTKCGLENKIDKLNKMLNIYNDIQKLKI